MRLRWTRLAEHDLEDIAQYVGQDSPAAAARVVLELIDQAETLLPKYPAIGRLPRRGAKAEDQTRNRLHAPDRP